ncbi:MAG: hypothetical protein ACYSYV_08980 [Planctomycetota bacterium]|jgi:hypothetical protein
MKPTENTEEVIRRGKPHVTTGRRMDKRVLDDSFAAMEETLGAKKPGTARIILRSRATRLTAAAAVIIVAVALFMVDPDSREQQPPPPVSVVKSPAEMLSAMSLNIAYRRGGIEAVDDQSNKAFEMLGSQPARVSIRELLAESNGV